MGVVNRVKNLFTSKRSKVDDDPFIKWSSPRNIFTSKSEYILANNETIFAAITKLSNAMSSLPLKLYEGLEVQKENRLNYLMSTAPNDNMTSFLFIQTMETLRNVYGNAYALKRYDSSFCVDGLDILNPALVEPVIEERSKELYYKVNAPDKAYYLHNNEVVHVKHISIGLKGISPINVLKNTVEYDNKIRQFSISQMDSSIKASLVLKVSTNMDKDKKADLKKQFEKFYSQNGGVIILESGYSLDPINTEFIDPKIFEIEKITRERVELVFNIPSNKFGKQVDLNNEQQSLQFIQDTILPIVRQYEQEFDKKLLTEEEKRKGYYFKFNLNGLLRADLKTRAEFYFKGIRSGFLTPNEARNLEDKPPLEGAFQSKVKLKMNKNHR